MREDFCTKPSLNDASVAPSNINISPTVPSITAKAFVASPLNGTILLTHSTVLSRLSPRFAYNVPRARIPCPVPGPHPHLRALLYPSRHLGATGAITSVSRAAAARRPAGRCRSRATMGLLGRISRSPPAADLASLAHRLEGRSGAIHYRLCGAGVGRAGPADASWTTRSLSPGPRSAVASHSCRLTGDARDALRRERRAGRWRAAEDAEMTLICLQAQRLKTHLSRDTCGLLRR